MEIHNIHVCVYIYIVYDAFRTLTKANAETTTTRLYNHVQILHDRLQCFVVRIIIV